MVTHGDASTYPVRSSMDSVGFNNKIKVAKRSMLELTGVETK